MRCCILRRTAERKYARAWASPPSSSPQRCSALTRSTVSNNTEMSFYWHVSVSTFILFLRLLCLRVVKCHIWTIFVPKVLHLTVLSQVMQKLTSMRFPVTHFQLHQRAKHVYGEAARVRQFQSACDSQGADSVQTLGELMNQSHASCRDLYECSCPELDQLVDVCLWVHIGLLLTTNFTSSSFCLGSASVIDVAMLKLCCTLRNTVTFLTTKGR